MTLFPSPAGAQCTVFNDNTSSPLSPPPRNYSPWAYPPHDRLEGWLDVLRGTWWLGRKVYAKFRYQESSSYLGKTEQCDLACVWLSHKVTWYKDKGGAGVGIATSQIPETWGLWKRIGSWGVALTYGISALLRKPGKAGWLSLLYEERGRKPPSWNRQQICRPLDLWLPNYENCGETCYLYAAEKKQPASILAIF